MYPDTVVAPSAPAGTKPTRNSNNDRNTRGNSTFLIGNLASETSNVPKQKGGLKPPIQSNSYKSEHFHAGYVNGVSGHCPRDRHVMSFMSFQYIRVVDVHDFLITIGNNHRVRALSQALGHAGCVARVGAFGAAQGVTHIPIHGRGLVRRRGYRNHEEQNRDGSTTHQYFFHSTPLLAVRPQIFETVSQFRCIRTSHKARNCSLPCCCQRN